MNIVEKIQTILTEIINDLGIKDYKKIHIEHPKDILYGDLSTNIAMVLYQSIINTSATKKSTEKVSFIDKDVNFWESPLEFANDVVDKLKLRDIKEIESIDVAGSGFINIKLSSSFFENSLKNIIEKGDVFGNLDIWKGKTVLVEHSSPNIFKPFHIGHMMNNTIGEAVVRLCKISGAKTKVISYPSDASLSIGKAVWQLMEYGVEKLDKLKTMREKITFLGKCYVDGTNALKENPGLELRMREITQDIYEHNDTNAYSVYKIGRDLNLEYFKQMTKRLGSNFDGYIFESEAGVVGKQLVEEYTPGIYTKSNGATIFKPSEGDLKEDKSLHTRVFINKDGNPTYEAKDTGLLKLKFDRYNPDLSIFITDSEQGPYFNVVSYAAGKINHNWKIKTHHMVHGRMKFKGQKMSSRLGNTPIVSDILDIINDDVYEKSENNSRDTVIKMTEDRADTISIAALKYSILRTQPGKNIDFDPDTSLSFEGDSGPYLQYTYARCQSILRKASEQGIKAIGEQPDGWEILDIERILYRLPGIFESALLNYSPQIVTNYVKEIAQLFNSWYGNTRLIDSDNSFTGYRLSVVKATSIVIKKSLWALGIKVLEEM